MRSKGRVISGVSGDILSYNLSTTESFNLLLLENSEKM